MRVQFTEEINIRLSWESILEYQNYSELYGEDAGYKPQGYLFLVPIHEVPTHMAGYELQKKLGVPVEVLNVEDA